MHRHRVVGLTVAGLTGVLGLAAPAWAEAPTTLYVNGNYGSCTAGGDGTQQKPFCTIGAAAAVALPGQTVQISPGTYGEQVVLTRSGEPGRPITFRTVSGSATVRADAQASKAAVVVSGAHDIAVESFIASGGVEVDHSDRITFDKVTAAASGARPTVLIGGGSQDVTYSRSILSAQGAPRVRIENASGTTLVRNRSLGGTTPNTSLLLSATDAPHTTVTNNSSVYGCGVVLDGDSAGSNIFNNVFAAAVLPTVCGGEKRSPITVAEPATAGTRVGYNLLNAPAGTALYSWGGTAYTDPGQFLDATGQGGHDLAVAEGQYPVGDLKAATDSADAGAPGVLETDTTGQPAEDDPRVPNTGTGHGYLDRGAAEQHDSFNSVDLAVNETWAPYGTAVTATATPRDTWPTALTYRFDFGDGTVVDTADTTASHVYTAPCDCVASVTGRNGAGVTRTSVPLAVKVTEPGALRAALDVRRRPRGTDDGLFHVPSLSVRAESARTVAPWKISTVSFDFGDGTGPQRAWSDGTAEHAYTAPGDYTVTVTVTDVEGAVSTASTTYRAAYAPAAYTAVSPFRMLDTRAGGSPLNGGSTMTLDVSKGYPQPDGGHTSLSPEAVVLNVTATKATGDTFIELWPTGLPRPTASHLNVKAGRTVANLVTVPVGSDGTVQLYSHGGRTDVIVDFVGVYEPLGPGKPFTPTAPTRISDAGLAGGATRTLRVTGKAGIPADATAVVVNLTAAAPTAGGFLIAYPHGTTRPGVSNLNFGPRDVVANQAIVPIGADGSIDVYNFAGTTRVVVDVFGYYSPGSKGWFTPAGPVRLADTRADGTRSPVAGGTSLSVPVTGTGGAPADATAAVLNVTATAPTASGFLTVWPHGTPRPGTSNLNFVPGLTVPNHVITRLGEGGRVDVQNFAGSTHVFADLAGWFTDHN
ncbi:hypothetical protein KNE206_20990 [Kitasatospora sp. NE20-6]|uniref:PKD domain-containing protein n=1 Tax=Kitasatospora sp. NE20-6 TaxID=2859066 RepID=UPI0034DC6B45